MTEVEVKLEPCPFCGNPPDVKTRRNSDLIEIFEIRCDAQVCMFIPHITVRVENKNDAITSWNTRPTSQRIERLEGALREIASFNDKDASEHLERTGSYSLFDEPGSVEVARAALQYHVDGCACFTNGVLFERDPRCDPNAPLPSLEADQ